MDIDVLEDEIAALLQTALGVNYEVAPNPENTEEYRKPFDKVRLWVGYQQSDLSDPVDTQAVIQDEKVMFIVTMQAATLREDNGIYKTKRKVQDALLGYIPTNCSRKIYGKYFGPPKSEDALIEDFWTYEYHLFTETKAVQARAEDDANLIPPVPGYQPDATVLVTITPQVPNVGNEQYKN